MEEGLDFYSLSAVTQRKIRNLLLLSGIILAAVLFDGWLSLISVMLTAWFLHQHLTWLAEHSSWVKDRLPTISRISAFAVTLLTVSVIARPMLVYWIGHHTEQYTISDAERAGSEALYRVYTKEGPVFEIHDSPWYLQFRSADLYNQVKQARDKKCELSYYGLRLGLLSWFPTITAVQCGN